MWITGDGETIEEALDMLNELKTEHFQRYLDGGRKLPEPKNDEEIKSFSSLRSPRAVCSVLVSLSGNQKHNGAEHWT